MPKIKLQVSPQGAELQSIAANGKEYLWQGCKEYWGRRAPILFPIVGRVADDTLRIDGKNYQMKQHGFARDTEFIFQLPNTKQFPFSAKIVSTTNTQSPLVYRMVNDDSHFYSYPYNYELSVAYHLQDKSLVASWEVKNVGTTDMYFQIGAHPAFLLQDYNEADGIHGYLQCLDENGKVVNPIINSWLKDGLRHSLPQPKILYDCDNSLAITNSTFANDAILIEGEQVQKVVLLDKNHKPTLSVLCPQAEAFGLWAPNKAGCPFVCIEPWCGIADRYDFSGNISEREYIHKLSSGNTFLFNYEIHLHE